MKIFMCWLLLFCFFAVSGCETARKSIEYPQGGRIVVTSGYGPAFRTEGTDYVFSLILPVDRKWIYYLVGPNERRFGYISAYDENNGKKIMIEWIWEAPRGSERFENDIKEYPLYYPWYSGQKGDGKRISYTPTEKQLQYGDWNSVGYPQELFTQSISRGLKPYYCMRAVIRRAGRTTWDVEHNLNAHDGPIYEIYDACPFRTIDGRDAIFKISNSFWIPETELAHNPNALDERLAALDAWLEPMWNSVEITPIAYQFDPPPNAASSIK